MIQHRVFKKIAWSCLSIAFLALAADISYRALPIVKSKESYRSFFPTDRFFAKLKEETPTWMENQLTDDFKEVEKITSDAIKDTYRTIQERIGNHVDHYRILNNRLYKYAPKRREFSSKDTPLEKAIKTLLLNVQVPDLDFLLCPMDGIPEGYVPKDFYLTDNQAPILGKAKKVWTKFIVLIPDQFSLSDNWYYTSLEIQALNKEISWEEKTNQAVWRGTLTDTGFSDDTAVDDFSFSPRYKLCKFSLQYPDLLNAGLIPSSSQQNNEVLINENLIKSNLSKRDHLLCKYQPVMDGHMCTYPGYQWRLLSNSIAFKQQSDQIQWFYGALEPYKHYVPIKNDMSDLLEKLAWAQANDQKLVEISQQARTFALNNLLLEDNYKYLYLVLKRYAELQEIDFQELKKETKSNPKWKCIQFRSRLRLFKTMKNVLNLR